MGKIAGALHGLAGFFERYGIGTSPKLVFLLNYSTLIDVPPIPNQKAHGIAQWVNGWEYGFVSLNDVC